MHNLHNLPMLPSLIRLCFFFIFCSVLSFFVGQPCSKPRVIIASPIPNSRSVKDSGKDGYCSLIFDVSKPKAKEDNYRKYGVHAYRSTVTLRNIDKIYSIYDQLGSQISEEYELEIILPVYCCNWYRFFFLSSTSFAFFVCGWYIYLWIEFIVCVPTRV